MSDYNTGNPVPSQDPRDLDDNATVFDNLLNASADYFPDRRGVLRKTWYRMEQDASALVSPNVSALAAIAGAADKAFYFSGPAAYGTYTLTSFMRTLGGSANAASARTTLGAMALADTGAYAGSAAKLTTARSIAATGDATWSVSFDGSANVTAALTLANSGVSAGTYGSVTVNAKGLVTGATTATPIANGGTNATTATAARTSLGVRNTSTRYIDGLEMAWGASSVTVGAGSAYIPGSGTLVESAADIVVNLSGLTAATFYHMYLYNNAGAAAVELVTTAPLAAATGGYTKTGDTSRRYLGSVLASGATSVNRFVQNGTTMHYDIAIAPSTPFELVNASATTATTVNASAVIPLTGVSALASVSNPSTTAGTTMRIANPDLGTVSSANHRQFATINSSWSGEILLNSSQQLSYVFDATPSNPGVIRVHGYNFKR